MLQVECWGIVSEPLLDSREGSNGIEFLDQIMERACDIEVSWW